MSDNKLNIFNMNYLNAKKKWSGNLKVEKSVVDFPPSNCCVNIDNQKHKKVF